MELLSCLLVQVIIFLAPLAKSMEFVREEVDGGYLYRSKPVLTFSEALNLLQDECELAASFRTKLESALTSQRSGTHAVFWECPPTTSDRYETQPFEFVVIFTDELRTEKVSIDEIAFASYLKGAEEQDGAVAFPSLGGDATMVSPTFSEDYTHLKAFLLRATTRAKTNLWHEVGRSFVKRLKATEGRVWLSTHGGGVPYLHVRICQAPRYYHYGPFADMQ